MTIETAEKLNNLFTENFLEENGDVSSISELYMKVREKDSTISETDFEEYVSVLSKKMHENDEISVDALDEVAGGIAWTTAAAIGAGIWTACQLISFSYKAGKAVGEAIYNWRH